jgi:hypothetical protein
VVTIGEVTSYRGSVTVPEGVGVRWRAPDTTGMIAWGARRAGRVTLGGGRDSVWVEVPLQAFALGALSIPGLGVELRSGGAALRYARLPMTRLVVAPVIPADDSTARLRGLRGPLAAPWWERVPWLWVAGALAVIAAVVWLVRRLRKRPPAKVAAPAPAPAVRRDPVAEALTELAALRRLGLPAQARYGEHAFHLSKILRRFLEATAGAPRPGDTTPELVERLRDAWLEPADLERLQGLLTRWDRVKFARAPSSAEDCTAAEAAVESWVRRFASPASKVA